MVDSDRGLLHVDNGSFAAKKRKRKAALKELIRERERGNDESIVPVQALSLSLCLFLSSSVALASLLILNTTPLLRLQFLPLLSVLSAAVEAKITSSLDAIAPHALSSQVKMKLGASEKGKRWSRNFPR